ncbi:MAG TPA: hypothetical protein VNJ28_06120 [Candidatus Limnocylindrales bacterium]|nr:hypothetical protein [Candidatus Limnocylindrales bacterium]
MALFPILLTIHICLAIGLFLPSLLLPFALRARARSAGALASGAGPSAEPGPVVRTLLFLQSHGTVVLGAGLAITGFGLVAFIGPELLGQPWLSVALAIYALNLGLAFFVQRPNLRRLLGLSGPVDEATWRARARRQRYVSYLMAGLVGTIGWLMSAKPAFW